MTEVLRFHLLVTTASHHWWLLLNSCIPRGSHPSPHHYRPLSTGYWWLLNHSSSSIKLTPLYDRPLQPGPVTLLLHPTNGAGADPKTVRAKSACFIDLITMRPSLPPTPPSLEAIVPPTRRPACASLASISSAPIWPCQPLLALHCVPACLQRMNHSHLLPFTLIIHICCASSFALVSSLWISLFLGYASKCNCSYLYII